MGVRDTDKQRQRTLVDAAFQKGFVDANQMQAIIDDTPNSSYRDYLEQVLKDGVS